ncbi:hypothetical protein Sjap_008266 [Stephania japonica]|uniref:Uncharacterized protein n=1 Tax=Stephania japonica TaxID=461633 RepID=A0AAP0JRJ3_9MAGN
MAAEAVEAEELTGATVVGWSEGKPKDMLQNTCEASQSSCEYGLACIQQTHTHKEKMNVTQRSYINNGCATTPT